MKLRHRRSAIEDLGEIRNHIAQDHPTVAARFVTAIRARCRLLAEQPHIGRERPELRQGLRSFAIRTYVIFCRIIGNTVEIVSVVHGSRAIDALFRERP
jgi:toxin ParE1/3/4